MAVRDVFDNLGRWFRGGPKAPDSDSEIVRLQKKVEALQNVYDQQIKANQEKDQVSLRLQKQVEEKDQEIRRLQEMDQEIRCRRGHDFFPGDGATPPLLQTAVDGVKDAIVVCATELVSRMKKSALPITFAGMNLDLKDTPDIRKFFLQSFLCHILFKCFEEPSFGVWDGSVNSAISGKAKFWHAYEHCRDMEVKQLLKKEAAFVHFLGSKDAELRMQLKEKFFLTEDVQKAEDFFTLELSSCAKDNTYYTKWVRLAKAVWVLHNLAFAFEPSNAKIFRVDKGSVLDAEIMEDVAPEDEDDDEKFTEDVARTLAGEEKVKKEVRFMCVPGFKVRNTIIKPRVFCVKR